MNLTFLWFEYKEVSFWLMVIVTVFSMVASFFVMHRSTKRHLRYGLPLLLTSFHWYHQIFVMFSRYSGIVFLTRQFDQPEVNTLARLYFYFPVVVSSLAFFLLLSALIFLCLRVLLKLFDVFKNAT